MSVIALVRKERRFTTAHDPPQVVLQLGVLHRALGS